MYSQNNEQLIITDYFKDKPLGKFLEIGAYHPFTFSNTRALFEAGWVGIYVEPAATNFDLFVKEYGSNPRLILLNYAIAAHNGTITFYDSGGDAIGTTSPAHKDKWEAGYKVQYKETQVPAMAMQTLVDEYGQDVDFLNLDVEGTNLELFNLIPDSFWRRLKMVCIEHDGHQQKIADHLSKFGFEQVGLNGENLLMAKK